MGSEQTAIREPLWNLFLFPLRVVENPKGPVLHVLKKTDPHFQEIAEVYCSITYPGSIKGWKRHHRMTQNFAVSEGEMEFCFYDDREDSPSKGKSFKVQMGPQNNYSLIRVPPYMWYSFRACKQQPAMILNCTSLVHDPSESETAPLDDPRFRGCW